MVVKKDPLVKKVEKKLTLLPSTIEYVTQYWADNGCTSFSDAVDAIVSKQRTEGGEQLLAEVIATSTAEQVVAQLKRPYLDPLRIRTGYADKQTKAMLEILNHLIVKNGWDAENVVTTDKRESNVLIVSQQKITDQIEHYKQKKATRENDRWTDQE